MKYLLRLAGHDAVWLHDCSAASGLSGRTAFGLELVLTDAATKLIERAQQRNTLHAD
jgi:hypothetical protein